MSTRPRRSGPVGAAFVDAKYRGGRFAEHAPTDTYNTRTHTHDTHTHTTVAYTHAHTHCGGGEAGYQIPCRCTICDTTCCSTPGVLGTSPVYANSQLNGQYVEGEQGRILSTWEERETTLSRQDSRAQRREQHTEVPPPTSRGATASRHTHRRDKQAITANLGTIVDPV